MKTQINKKKIVQWIVKGFGIAVLAYMAIVGIIRFTIYYAIKYDYYFFFSYQASEIPSIQFYMEAVFMILLAALAIVNMFELGKLKPFFKLLQTMRGRGIFMLVLAFWTMEWTIKWEIACFALMLIAGAGFIVFSFVVKEEEPIS